MLLVASVFVAAFVMDTTALVRLLGASLSGQFGPVPRFMALAVLLVGATPVLRAVYHHLTAPAPAPASRRKPRSKASPSNPVAEAPQTTVRQVTRAAETHGTGIPKPRRKAGSASTSSPRAR